MRTALTYVSPFQPTPVFVWTLPEGKHERDFRLLRARGLRLCEFPPVNVIDALPKPADKHRQFLKVNGWHEARNTPLVAILVGVVGLSLALERTPTMHDERENTEHPLY